MAEQTLTDGDGVGDATPRSQRKRKGEGHTRREEILDVARDLFATEGYDAVTIRKIAAGAGISSTALYLYFADKDAILLEVCERTFQTLLATFCAQVQANDPPLVILRKMMEAYVRFGLRHQDEYRLVFMMKEKGLGHPHHKRGDIPEGVPGASGPRAYRMLRDHVATLMADGLLRGDDPDVLAEVIWASGHGLVSLLVTHPSFPWSDRDALVQASLDVMFNGMVAT